MRAAARTYFISYGALGGVAVMNGGDGGRVDSGHLFYGMAIIINSAVIA